MKFPKLDLRKKLNTVTDSEGNVFTAEKSSKGFIVNCKSQNKENHFCFANDVKDLFMLFMDNDNQKAIAKLLNKLQAEPAQAEPAQAEPAQAEPKKDNTMLTINDILAVKPQLILAVNYNESIGDMLGDESNNEYLADMTIQYHSLTNDACLSFTVECLVSVTDNKVTIEEMNTSPDIQAVYANNISDLSSFNGNSVRIWSDDICEDMHNFLVNLIESQPIYDIPEHFIIEAY